MTAYRIPGGPGLGLRRAPMEHAAAPTVAALASLAVIVAVLTVAAAWHVCAWVRDRGDPGTGFTRGRRRRG